MHVTIQEVRSRVYQAKVDEIRRRTNALLRETPCGNQQLSDTEILMEMLEHYLKDEVQRIYDMRHPEADMDRLNEDMGEPDYESYDYGDGPYNEVEAEPDYNPDNEGYEPDYEVYEVDVHYDEEPLTFEDVRVSPGIEIKSLDHVEFRIYHYDDTSYLIENPIALRVSDSGAHYVVDGGGLVHYMKPDFNTVTWGLNDDSGYHITF